MGKKSRFLFGFLLSFWLVLPMAATVLAKEGCHPSTCHSWDYWDWEYWYFNCSSEHCPECGYGAE